MTQSGMAQLRKILLVITMLLAGYIGICDIRAILTYSKIKNVVQFNSYYSIEEAYKAVKKFNKVAESIPWILTIFAVLLLLILISHYLNEECPKKFNGGILIFGIIAEIFTGTACSKLEIQDFFDEFTKIMPGAVFGLLSIIITICIIIAAIYFGDNQSSYSQSSNTSSGSTGGSYNLIEIYNNRWQCPFCGQQNTGDVSTCIKCGINKSDRPTPKESDFWICRHCGTKNNMRDRYCKSCRQDKLSAPKVPPTQQDDTWKCSKCGELNNAFSYVCQKCGKSKY